MPLQVWVQCPRREVQRTKLLLEKAGQLNKAQRVISGPRGGQMIIPTNWLHDRDVLDDDRPGDPEVLSGLGLGNPSLELAIEVIYISSASLRRDYFEAKKHSALVDAVSKWLDALPDAVLESCGAARTDLLCQAPKRWSVYDPMVILPSGTFQSPAWQALLATLPPLQLSVLWCAILQSVEESGGSTEPLTHLAINAGIPSTSTSMGPSSATTPTETSPTNTETNILRQPTSLLPLHGDFGPPSIPHPGPHDLASALWVRARQNGIWQTWAPRHTMFSRGNIKEKARLLSFPSPAGYESVSTREGGEEETSDGITEEKGDVAVDLYAGIGYFAFSYAARGFKYVLCWEINPWSVEGLRRGAALNHWRCSVITCPASSPVSPSILSSLTLSPSASSPHLIIVFQETNLLAPARIAQLRAAGLLSGSIRHVNCGFLPSSQPSWPSAWQIVSKRGSGGWLHLHENVGVGDIEDREEEIGRLVGGWGGAEGKEEGEGEGEGKGDGGRAVEVVVEHVERVKTFAPGVWHCVFDVRVRPGGGGMI